MTNTTVNKLKLGWIGTGRMGYAMVSRLLKHGCDVAVYNRTRSKAEPLTALGATVVNRPIWRIAISCSPWCRAPTT
jgi:3-hydroxyisobutyrate dehydrogenase